jgi:LysR family transcriptional regulator, mexEF-oprN operon transcriptional activator
MNQVYGRDLDLNLLRVFTVVAESGSVTAAASRLYLTQPAVSAALRRLTTALGAPLFARQGRGLVLTTRGSRLLVRVQPHLRALVELALSPPAFDPGTSERTFRLGLADAAEAWLLPPLLRALAAQAPRMRVIALPVQFRNVTAALSGGGVDAAITVADELPAGVRRQQLYRGGFVCLHDPRHARLGRRPTRARYFAHEHVVVSYNGDLRGIVEDVLGQQRKVRCSVASFAHLGALVEGSALLATVPALVARHILALRPKLRARPLPFRLAGVPIELLWPQAVEDDDAFRFLRARIIEVAAATTSDVSAGAGAAPGSRSRY